MPEQAATNSNPEQAVMPWYIPAGDDGLRRDCIMVAVMHGSEIQSISLHLASTPAET